MSVFPASRLRRLRRTDTLRAMVRETSLAPGDFILPFFVTHGRGVRDEVRSMPGVFQLSVDELVRDVRDLPGLGIPSVLLFGLLAAMAVVQAQAGADVVAPSDMMDGRVGAIRRALDEHRLADMPIMAYSAKFASGFYGPFREAAESTPQFGDRRAYQMDPANGREAMREIAQDVAEGADMIMVKPALAYLDLIRRAREQFDLPVVAYNVSGEYAMVKAAAQNGWIDEQRIVLEILTGIKRAGADLIISYHARDVARWLS